MSSIILLTKLMKPINLSVFTKKKQKTFFKLIGTALDEHLKSIDAPIELQKSNEFKFLIIQFSTYLTFEDHKKKSSKKRGKGSKKKSSKKKKLSGGTLAIRRSSNNRNSVLSHTRNTKQELVPFGSAPTVEKIRRLLTGLTMSTYNKFGKLGAYIMVLSFIGVTIYYAILPTITNLEANYEQIEDITYDIKKGQDIIQSLLHVEVPKNIISTLTSLVGSVIVGNTGQSIESQIAVVNAEINLALAKMQKTQLSLTSNIYMLGYCLIFIAYFVYLMYFIHKIKPEKMLAINHGPQLYLPSSIRQRSSSGSGNSSSSGSRSRSGRKSLSRY
jgi:hypothetical protein